MRKLKLYNKKGEFITEINIKSEGVADCIQWGNMIYIWDNILLHFREANVYPAIINKSKN